MLLVENTFSDLCNGFANPQSIILLIQQANRGGLE